MISALADDNPVVRAGRADRRGVQLRRGGPWLDIERPRKRTCLGWVPRARAADVNRAVQAARRTFVTSVAGG